MTSKNQSFLPEIIAQKICAAIDTISDLERRNDSFSANDQVQRLIGHLEIIIMDPQYSKTDVDYLKTQLLAFYEKSAILKKK